MEHKTVAAGVLETAYLDYGAADGWPCIMLHGFPYDVQAYAECAPILAEVGARVVVPYMRGYGPTRFLSANPRRSGAQALMRSRTHTLTHSYSRAITHSHTHALIH